MARGCITLRTVLVLNFSITFSVCGWADSSRKSVAQAFTIAPAAIGRIVNGERRLIQAAGEVNGVAVTGYGVYTFSPAIAADFAEQAGMSNRKTLIAKMYRRDKTLMLEVESDFIVYYDSNYQYLGEIDQSHASGDADQRYGSYKVVTGKGSTPAIVRVNDFGSLSSETVYKDLTKAVILGTETSTYLIEPDTASSVIYRISAREFGKSGNFLRSSETRYRLDAKGGCSFVSLSVRDKKSTLHFVAQ